MNRRRREETITEITLTVFITVGLLFLILYGCTPQQRKPTRQTIGKPYVEDPELPRFKERD